MLNNRTPTKLGQHDASPVLKQVRKSVYRQGLLAGFLIILTVVILFAVTAAWYTNIIQTNDLVFKASEWGFKGEVKSVDATIIAGPGDEGFVELTAENQSDEIMAVGINVSKEEMPAEIQKRIYFYADTAKLRSGEAMNRVYLGSGNSYTYMLLGRKTLTLSETGSNDTPVKWQWVYDVLGYYVQGTWDGTRMEDEEYLRPIEYNYDEATTKFDENGNLINIDESTSVELFLSQLSAKDGYPGIIDASKKNSGGYYPVSVDDSGYGVWAYLCRESEIAENTRFDTELGSGIEADGSLTSYVAKLTLSAQNSYLEPASIGTASSLTAAVNSGGTAVLQLDGDVALTEVLTIGTQTEPQQVMLDLGGNTLTLKSGDAAGIQVAAGSSLVLTNGELAGNGEGYAINGAGAEVVLSGVEITNVERALYVRDNAAENTLNADARIHLDACTIETSDVSIFLSGNGEDSAQATQLIVENSTIISSDYGGIVCNGSPDQYGTEIQIINSTVTGKWCGIYHPQDKSTLSIAKSTISGYTGLVLKGGTTTVLDSTILGTGEGVGSNEPTVSLSGFADTGDAIYIESNYIDYHGYDISLSVSGNSVVTSEKNLALRIYPDNDAVSVSISGGTFSSPIADQYLTGNTVCAESNGVYVVSTVAAQEESDTSEA